MNYFKQILFTTLLLFSSVTNAAWVDKKGNVIPDSDSMKAVGDLIAQLIITDNEAQVLKNWNTPSQGVYFPTADKIEKNKIITMFIVFGACAVDADGNCDLKMQITVYQPNGTIYAKLPIYEVWSGKPVPPDKSLGLSVDYLRVIIEPHEPLGKYKVDVKVIDNISGNNMLLTSHFTAVEPNE